MGSERPGTGLPQELRADPTLQQGGAPKAERAQPEGCAQAPGRGLEVNGYGRRRQKEKGLENKDLALRYGSHSSEDGEGG